MIPQEPELPMDKDTTIIEKAPETPTPSLPVFQVGAERTALYFPLLYGQKIGLVVNPSSRIGERHLVDSLQAAGFDVARIFVPEHGLRGTADAGVEIADGVDLATGIPVVSLYGNRKKPDPEQLADLEYLVFDMQDVGARFYTYLSTLHYCMQACAESGKGLILLDRPNPNGHYVDGPVLKPGFESFVGLHPIPVVHGMTLGELAGMINGEGWLGQDLRCRLTVIPCSGYSRLMPYELPVRPSPNLPNIRSVYLYPSLCFFEGTIVSVGRGTEGPFQLYGLPGWEEGPFVFTPESRQGALQPKYLGQECRGYDLRSLEPDSIRAEGRLNLDYLLKAFNPYHDPERFFLANHYFDLLAGEDRLRNQILDGLTETAIRETWKEELQIFREKRKTYLIYPGN